MNWTEQKTGTRENISVTDEKARLFEEVKKELPVVQKEADAGVRPFEAISLQPIKGVGTFEAEFGQRGEDIIFHFWPWGYHDKEREGDERLPAFKKDFEPALRASVAKVFGEHRCEFKFDGDVGAWFVKANNFASNQFYRDLCIEAATLLHTSLGGTV